MTAVLSSVRVRPQCVRSCPGARRRVVCGSSKRSKRRQSEAMSRPVSVPSYAPALVEVPRGATSSEDGEVIDWGHELLGVDETWQHTRGRGIKVAVLDTGAHLEHPDLQENILAVKDFTGGSTGAADRQGHGTHCAGIVAAVDNEIGVIGVASKASLLIGKVLGDNGSGAYSWITNGINWAVDQGADIISMSLGGPSPNSAMKQAIDRAIAAGVIVIAAAGNDGSRRWRDTVNYPGNYPDVIAVGSIDRDGRRSHFSSAGMNIDIMAPGGSVTSTWIPPRAYHTISGTSMATPFVAGVCALALAKNRASGGTKINQRRMFDLLRDNATDMRDEGWDKLTGWGLVDLGFIEGLSVGAMDEVDEMAMATGASNGGELARDFALHVEKRDLMDVEDGKQMMCEKKANGTLVCRLVE